MASMKITVDELSFLKTIYSKAAKNLRDVISVVKKAKTSIGNDKMTAEARSSLGKLAENMDRRATVLEALAEALTYSGDTYKGAQKRAVSSISDYRAHKTDFYGNPVHVSGAAGGGAAAAAAGGATVAAASGSGGAQTTSYSSGASSSGGSTVSASAGSTTASAEGASQVSASETVTNNTYINNTTINVSAAPEAPADAGIGAETVSLESGMAAATPAGAAAAAESAGLGGAAMFGAGVAAAAAVGGAAFGASKVVKKKKEENSIDHQIEVAKKKLEAIEKEQDGIRANLSEE